MTTMTTPTLAKSFDVPDQTFPMGSIARVEVIQLGETVANRVTFQPGFHWTEHAKPTAGTDLCMIPHTGYVVSGRAGIRMADGTEREVAAGDAFAIPAGHDTWVIGDAPYVAVDFSTQTVLPDAAASTASVPPKDHIVLLDNDTVRVMELRIRPGESTGMHAHPPCVVYALSTARVRFTLPDGTARETDIRQGVATWSAGGWHDVENIGETDDWGVIVELKQAQRV